METPRTARSTAGSRTPRTTARSLGTPRTPARAPITARPSVTAAAGASEASTTPGKTRPGSVFDRLTTGLPSSAANRYGTSHTHTHASKLSWTSPPAKVRRGTAPSLTALSPNATGAAQTDDQTPQTARPRPAWSPPGKIERQPRGASTPSAMPATHGGTTAAVVRPVRLSVAPPPPPSIAEVCGERRLPEAAQQGSPGPLPPRQAIERSPSPLETDLAPAMTREAVALASVRVEPADDAQLPAASSSSSPARATKVVRKQPPPSTRHGAAADKAPVPFGGARPHILAAPTVLSVDEEISLTSGSAHLSPSPRSQSPFVFYAESTGAAAVSTSVPHSGVGRLRPSTTASPQARQFLQLLDGDGDGVVSADDLFAFVLLHADTLLTIGLAELDALMTSHLRESPILREAVGTDWRLAPTLTTAENAVTTLLLLAAHVDHGAEMRTNWVCTALQGFLAAPTETNVDLDTAATAALLRSVSPEHSPAHSATLRALVSPSRTHSRRMSAAHLVLPSVEETAENVVDKRRSPTPGLDDSYASTLTLSVGSWSPESTRALLRSIQFREMAPAPPFLTVTALESLLEVGLALTTPTSAVLAEQARLVAALVTQLEASGDRADALLTRLAVHLHGPLLLCALTSQLTRLDAAQLSAHDDPRPLASPLRATLWRLAVPVRGPSSPPARGPRGVCASLHGGVSRLALGTGDAFVAGALCLGRRAELTTVASSDVALPGHRVRRPACARNAASSRLVEPVVREMCAVEWSLQAARHAELSASFTTWTAHLSPSVVRDVFSAVPYVPVFRSAREHEAVYVWLHGCLGQGTWLSGTDGESRWYRAALMALSVLIAVFPRVCLTAVGAGVLYVVVALITIVLGVLWRWRASWCALLTLVWRLPPSAPCETAPTRSALDTALDWHRDTQRLSLLSACGAGFSDGPSSTHLRWLLCQQAEWWSLDFLPLFFSTAAPGGANAAEDALLSSTDTVPRSATAATPALYHIPLSVYMALATVYLMADAADDDEACPRTPLPAPADSLWRSLSSLTALTTLRAGTPSWPQPSAHADTPTGAAVLMTDVEVLCHPLFQEMVQTGVALVREARATSLHTSPPPQPLLEACARVFHRGDTTVVSTAVEAQLPPTYVGSDACLAVPPLPCATTMASAFVPSSPFFAAAVEVQPFVYRRLWRRDQRECAAVFASVLYLLAPPSVDAGETKAQRARLLVAAVLLSLVSDHSETEPSLPHNWSRVEAFVCTLQDLRATLLTCLGQGNATAARALASPQSILSRCLMQTWCGTAGL